MKKLLLARVAVDDPLVRGSEPQFLLFIAAPTLVELCVRVTVMLGVVLVLLGFVVCMRMAGWQLDGPAVAMVCVSL